MRVFLYTDFKQPCIQISLNVLLVKLANIMLKHARNSNDSMFLNNWVSVPIVEQVIVVFLRNGKYSRPRFTLKLKRSEDFFRNSFSSFWQQFVGKYIHIILTITKVLMGISY